MFLKLAYNAKRNKITAIIQLVTPIINISISVLISRSWKFLKTLPPLVLSLESGFEKTETLLSELSGLQDVSPSRMAERAYKEYFKTQTEFNMELNDLGTSPLEKIYLKMVRKRYFFISYLPLTYFYSKTA